MRFDAIAAGLVGSSAVQGKRIGENRLPPRKENSILEYNGVVLQLMRCLFRVPHRN